MFCKNCGSQIADDAAFCNNCGTAVNSDARSVEKVEDNQVILTVKPTFKIGYEIISALLKSLLTTIVIIFFIIDEAFYLVTFPYVYVVVAFVYLIKLFFDKAQYKNTEFKFYATKVEYVDGFLNKEQKEIKYKNIKEVTKTENILERMFGLGKVKMITNVSMARNSKAAKNGITVHCVQNVGEIAKQINELVDKVDDDE